MINYYAPVVYQNAMGLSRNLSLILGGCTSLAYLVGSIVPLWSMDAFGRRTSLMVSAAGLCACFILTAALLSTGKESCAYAATVFVFIFQIFLGFGYLPVPWYVIVTHDASGENMKLIWPQVLSQWDHNNPYSSSRSGFRRICELDVCL